MAPGLSPELRESDFPVQVDQWHKDADCIRCGGLSRGGKAVRVWGGGQRTPTKMQTVYVRREGLLGGVGGRSLASSEPQASGPLNIPVRSQAGL